MEIAVSWFYFYFFYRESFYNGLDESMCSFPGLDRTAFEMLEYCAHYICMLMAHGTAWAFNKF
jgi:hypothetical protein